MSAAPGRPKPARTEGGAESTPVPWRRDGETMVLDIIGDPVVQVKAPQPLTDLMERQGFSTVLVLVPLQVAAPAVPALLDVLLQVRNFAGLIVTEPHKQLVAGLSMQKDPRGQNRPARSGRCPDTGAGGTPAGLRLSARRHGPLFFGDAIRAMLPAADPR